MVLKDQRSVLQRFCIAVHNQNFYTLLGMAGGCSLFEKKDKLEVKGIYIIFRMCACEGIDALKKQLLYLFSI